MASCAQNLVVDVEGGQIEGVIDQEGIVVYKGIPYAAPPVGSYVGSIRNRYGRGRE